MDDQKKAIRVYETVYRGDIQQVKELLDSGVDVNEQDKKARPGYSRWNQDDSLVHIAAVGYNNRYMMQLLLKRNASVSVKNFHGNTPLHYAIGIRPVKPEHVKLILACDADTEQKNNFGLSSLCLAAILYINLQSIRRLFNVKTLLKYNAQVNIKGGDGVTPLDYLRQIDGIKEFYLDYEESQKKVKKKRK